MSDLKPSNEEAWLQALHHAFNDNLGVLSGNRDETVSGGDLTELIALIQSVDQIPEIARQRIVALFDGTDRQYALKLMVKANAANLRLHDAMLVDASRFLAVKAEKDADPATSYSDIILDLAVDSGIDERTIERSLAKMGDANKLVDLT